MNERIKELAEQSGLYHRSAKGSLYPSVMTAEECNSAYEKFALLIIQEYEKLLPDSCPWAGADQEGPMKGWHVQHVARRHFGVEE